MSRRTLLGGLAAIAANPTAALPAQPADTDALDRRPAASPDDELIRLCLEHPTIIAAVNDYGSSEDDCSLWQAYERSRNAINSAVPVTMAGMVAKARAAKAEARNLDGSESPNGCPAETWAWDLVNDLLRLEGGA